MANEGDGALATNFPWMKGYVDMIQKVAASVRKQEFAAADRMFADWLAWSRHEASRPAVKKEVLYSTHVAEVFEERLACILERNGYLTVGSLAAASDEELLGCARLGQLAVAEIRKVVPAKVAKETVHGYFAEHM